MSGLLYQVSSKQFICGSSSAVAGLIPGTIAYDLACDLTPLGPTHQEHVLAMQNPAGILRARVYGKQDTVGQYDFPWMSEKRNAQTFLRGFSRFMIRLCNGNPSLKIDKHAFALGLLIEDLVGLFCLSQ